MTSPLPSTAPSRRAKILEICSYPPPRAGWSMRVEVVTRQLRAEGHECVVLNTGTNRRVPSPEYETVMDPLDFVKKTWRFSRAGYTLHAHVNGDSYKGFVRTLLSQLINLATGKRCYLTFHAGVDQIYFPRAKAPALLPLYWIMFKIPRRIICNSEAVRAKIVEYGVRPDKIEAIPAFTRQYLEFQPVRLAEAAERFFARFPRVLFTYVRIREGFNLSTLIEGFAILTRCHADVGLLLVGVTDDIDPVLWEDFQRRMQSHGLTDRVCLVDDLEHDAFLTALTRSVLYIRTPTTDGVASSVLEALALGIPTVAAENGTRPRGVITFKSDDPADLAAKTGETLRDRDSIAATMPRPEIRDTLRDEIRVLTGR
jgi:glycosyltransferase involved in cell wall biosynthesis